jgi:AmiR/NasT family two-component response regulator
MTDQETRARARARARRGSGLGPAVFHQAVSILQARHHLAEIVAYEMLVHGAAESGTSVREAAEAVIAGSSATA